jgi:CopA family copper-resistance protein
MGSLGLFPVPQITRRRFVQSVATAGALSIAPWPVRQMLAAPARAVLSGTEFQLEIARMPFNITGMARSAVAVNGQVPAPTLRWREGDTVTLAVTNRLSEPTSIHWHGILLPNPMDGVPGLTFRGIAPGETFVYRFPVHQSGTYWYHSHSEFQEQLGLYGAIVIEPKGGYPQEFDRDYVIFLSDWSDESPDTIISNLKFQSDYYNFHQRTVGTFVDDVNRNGLAETVADRIEWGKMRMSPTDILDVSGATYTYLINGQPPTANWTALFKPGERVRLRFINGSAMSIFDVRIPDLAMSVVQADGNDVHPVPVDEFRLGVAETYDVIVEPREDRAFTLFVQPQDRTGFARGTLAPRPGMAAPIPPLDPRPMRSMTDMGMGGMDHGSMGGTDMGSMPGMDHGSMPGMNMNSGSMGGMSGMQHGASSGAATAMPMNHGSIPGMSGMQHGASPGAPTAMPMKRGSMPAMSGVDHSSMPGMDHGSAGAMPAMRAMAGMAASPEVAKLEGQVGVDNVAMMPKERLGEAGVGLEGNGRRVLRYTDLRALKRGSDPRPPTRDITLHLTGNMERFMWGFDGKKFSEAAPIELARNERVRFVLINDTMMEHPIHLHGMFSELENAHAEYRPYKHTISVKPGERLSFLVTADVPGRWAFHCHLLYHMEAGMFREVRVA